MSVQRSTKVPEDLDNRLRQVEEDFDVDSSGAQRRVMDEGLRALGYYPTHARPETPLRRMLREVAKMVGVAGVTLIGLALFSSASLRFVGFLTVVASVLLFGAERVLARYEPHVSARLGMWAADSRRESV